MGWSSFWTPRTAMLHGTLPAARSLPGPRNAVHAIDWRWCGGTASLTGRGMMRHGTRYHRCVTHANFLLVSALMTGAIAQDVGSLQGSSFDLPQTDLDREVLTLCFGAIDAVHSERSSGLQQSLEAERALAACATFSSFSIDLARQLTQIAFGGNFDGTSRPMS